MHRDKTLARILLILSVVHFAAAAPAIVRQRSLDVDEDVTAASEKRGNSGNTPQDSHPVPQMDIDPPPESGTAQLDDGPQPASGASHLHNNPPLVLGTPQLHGESLTASETSSVHDHPPLGPEAFDGSYRFKDVPYAPSSHESDRPPTRAYNHRRGYASVRTTQPTHSLISDQVKVKLQKIGVVAALAASLVGTGFGLLSYVFAFFHPSPANTEPSHKHSDL